jgi:hypothetical protein
MLYVATLHTHVLPPFPFFLPVVLPHDCILLLETSMSHVVSPHTHYLPPMIFVLHTITLHAQGFPPMISMLRDVNIHALAPPLVTSMWHDVVHCASHMNHFCCMSLNLGGAFATFLIFPSMF